MKFGADAISMNQSDITWNDSTVSPSECVTGYWEHSSTVVYPVEYYKDSLYLWVLTTVTVVGILGNSISIFTILRLHPVTSASLCIVFLAIADSLSLLSKTSYMHLSHYNVNIGNYGCRIFPYILGVWPMIANWIIVLMTTERFVATWFPLCVYRISKLKTTSLLTLGLSLFFLAANSVHLFLFEQTSDGNGRFYCLPQKRYQYFVTKIWFWTEGSLCVICPCVMLIALNSLIIIGARKSLRRCTVYKRKQQTQITAMLVTVSVVFILLTVPGVILSIILGKWHYYASPEWRNASTTVRVLSDLNHAINFFLYFLSGRRFRRFLAFPNEYQNVRRPTSV